MCEYDPDCTKRNDPTALALWRRKKDAVLTVYCPKDKHPLAAVFEAADGRLLLCTPSIEWGPSPGGSEVPAPHLHAVVIPLADAPAIERGRCRCGTWAFRPQLAVAELAAWSAEGQAKRAAAGLPPLGRSSKKHANRPYLIGNYVKFDRPDAP